MRIVLEEAVPVTRLALIGASHLVALWNASLDMAAEAKGVELTFIPASYDGSELVIADGRITGGASSARVRRRMEAWGVTGGVTIAEFDAFAIVGVVRFPAALTVYQHCRGESHTNPGDALPHVSDACFDAAVAGVGRPTLLWTLARKLAAAAPSVPIAVLPAPFYSASILAHGQGGAPYAELNRLGDEGALAGSWNRALRIMAGDRFTLINQPPDTLETPVLTQERFSVGKRKVKGSAIPIHDHSHMNAAFGAILLGSCIDFACAAAASSRRRARSEDSI